MNAAMSMSHAIPTHEQATLVALSVAVAIVASYLALDLAQRSAGTTGWTRRGWLTAGGVTVGLGIWSMHFIGMFALKMSMPVSYDLGLVVLSMFAAIAGAVIALSVVARPDAGRRSLLCAAAFLGLAIAAMHYLGMASMEMDASIHWSAPLVALSLLIAFVAALAALYLVMQLGRARFRLGLARRGGAALVLGFGIAGLHYTAMAAATFQPTMAGMNMHHGSLGAGGLVVLLGIGAGVMLAILIAGGAFDQRRAAVAIDLALVARLARGLSAGEGARDHACASLLELSGADFVLLIEPGEGRAPSVVASAGLEGPVPTDVLADEGELLGAIGERSEPTFIAELPAGSVLGGLGATSALYEPLVLDRQPIGVFAVTYRSGRRRVGERTSSLLSMLAAEAALAIDREDLIARLDFMARRDELTGLVNRRVLRETLDAELSAAAGSGAPLALAILDLDCFKQVNDRLGHQAGDRLLRTAAAAWEAELRSGGTIGRYGGDEFVAILPGVGEEAAAAVTERLRAAVPDGATCSAGVAVWDGEASAAQLMAGADALLYAAKENGRDRTATAPPRDPSLA
jgi:diguanylate cyclase (GGDEF)-like protein